jgi:hypothetical protein
MLRFKIKKFVTWVFSMRYYSYLFALLAIVKLILLFNDISLPNVNFEFMNLQNSITAAHVIN